MVVHRPQIGEHIAFIHEDTHRIGKIVGWYDKWNGHRTFVVEVGDEQAPYSSDGRWHVSELAAFPAEPMGPASDG